MIMAPLTEKTMFYQKLLHELGPDLNPAGVEASMRLQYGTLGHLPREIFAQEVELATECEGRFPGYLREIAESFGMVGEFEAWEEKK